MQPQPTYLLHRRPYRETSALVDLISAEYGRVRAVARGVMRPGSKARHRLQPFSPLHLTWTGNGELKTLRLIESGGPGAMLAGEGLLCGFYANELLTRCLPLELPAQRVFIFYASLLEALPVPSRRAAVLRRFEITLLESLDADPVFLTETDTPLDASTRYVYQAHWRRFRPAHAEEPGLDGRALLWLARDDWEAPGLAGVARSLTRAALAPLLGDRPLRSRELMQDLLLRRRQRQT
ncbi:DNA repair protein RecO [Kushneria phosphatilytica]|uniref:DNA repair protein RecO n=1 Tax=Kushneria phosphatilytica TaxID=657387 RepID=A0A1S1NRH0_9GAMM|nr:DNA repair protein RecO [Kushneria phosphatilytica]OHV11829.1 DNA repair protein RecO [Kushneria phosphatilytica]QEL10997.1 DNA repair protein RecO [Kushneria phosphatilytica]